MTALALTASITAVVLWKTAGADQSRRQAMDHYGEVPNFALVMQDGTPYTHDRLLGQVTIANFIFTRCPTVCPVFTMKMKRLHDRTQDVGARLQLVSFSVDPEHDSPEVLARYAAEQGADPSRWSFITGDAAAVRATVENGLKISMDRKGTLADGVPDIVHGSHFVLIDGAGEIRGYYNSDDRERIESLISDARQLVSDLDR